MFQDGVKTWDDVGWDITLHGRCWVTVRISIVCVCVFAGGRRVSLPSRRRPARQYMSSTHLTMFSILASTACHRESQLFDESICLFSCSASAMFDAVDFLHLRTLFRCVARIQSPRHAACSWDTNVTRPNQMTRRQQMTVRTTTERVFRNQSH